MSATCTVVVDERLQAYDFGPAHPLGPIRLKLSYAAMQAAGLLSLPDVAVSTVTEQLGIAELEQVHAPQYVAAVQAASATSDFFSLPFGIGTSDVPRFDGMHAAALRVCEATLTASRAVAAGRSQHAVNIAGGLHHAMPDHASGFCIYNDIAVAIRDLLAHGVERIAYVDVDAHHGDGVERIFWDDPRVMTISIHQTGRTLFPGTGFAEELGGTNAVGTAVNIALPPHTSDAEWLRAFTGVVPELLADFQPTLIFSQHGCDSHRLDPLTSMELSIDGQRTSYELIHQWAHEYSAGKWVAVGGGGYALEEVVPRAWAHLVAIAAHQPQLVTFTDGMTPLWKPFETGWDPHSELDRAIMATRRSVFPLHGLIADPMYGF